MIESTASVYGKVNQCSGSVDLKWRVVLSRWGRALQPGDWHGLKIWSATRASRSAGLLTPYSVSFWLDNYYNNANPTSTGQGFTANFGSGSISTNTNLTAYTQFSFTATATSSATTLNLAGFDYTNSGYYMLDGVSVTAEAASGLYTWSTGRGSRAAPSLP